MGQLIHFGVLVATTLPAILMCVYWEQKEKAQGIPRPFKATHWAVGATIVLSAIACIVTGGTTFAVNVVAPFVVGAVASGPRSHRKIELDRT